MARLTRLSTDYDQLVAEFRRILRDDTRFPGINPDELAPYFADIMASYVEGSYSQIQIAHLNQFADTVLNYENAWAIAELFGSPRRKTGAQVIGNITNSTNELIRLGYEDFTIRGRDLNWITNLIPERDGEDTPLFAAALILQPGQTREIGLSQGIFREQTFRSNGQPNQTYFVSQNYEADFHSVSVSVGATGYERRRNAVFNDLDTPAFSEFTTPDGRVGIRFNDRENFPSVGSTIRIRWIDTAGTQGNSELIGQDFQFSIPGLTFEHLLNNRNGTDQETFNELRTNPRARAASNGRLVTQRDFEVFIRALSQVGENVLISTENSRFTRTRKVNPDDKNKVRIIASSPTVETTELTIQDAANQQVTRELANKNINVGYQRLKPYRGTLRISDTTGRTLTDEYGTGLLTSRDDVNTHRGATIYLSNNSGYDSNVSFSNLSRIPGTSSNTEGRLIRLNAVPTAEEPVRIGGTRSSLSDTHVADAMTFLTPPSNGPKLITMFAREEGFNVANLDSDDGWDLVSDTLLIPDVPNQRITVPVRINNANYSSFMIRVDEAYTDGTGFQFGVIHSAYGTPTGLRNQVSRVLSYDVQNNSREALLVNGHHGLRTLDSATYVGGDITTDNQNRILDSVREVAPLTTELEMTPMNVQRYDVNANVSIRRNSGVTVEQIQNALNAQFQGNESNQFFNFITRNDIVDTIKTIDGVDSVEIITPTEDLLDVTNAFYLLDNVTINLSTSSRPR